MKIVVSQSTLPSFNLAAEEYLFNRRGESFFFLYRNDPCVIIGSNQAVVNEVDQDYCIEHDIRIIRRISGGGAVYHDRGNLNYSLLQDKTEAPLSAHFLEPVVAVLRALSVPAEVGKRKDLWLNGRKISGTASHVSLYRELHHGTLLYDTDLDALQQALAAEHESPVKKATASVPSPVTNIRSYLAEKGADAPEIDAFLEIFAAELLLHYGEREVTPLPADAPEAIGQLQKDKYTCRNWNYRL
jgi:lipoate-protein ligase A